MRMLFQEKINQLETAFKERDIDTQLDIVEELLTSSDNDIRYHVDNALSYNSTLWLIFAFDDFELDELRDKLDEVVELLLDYGEKYCNEIYEELLDELEEFKENMLDYHREYEKLCFGVADDYAKGYEYEEISEDDLDY